MPKAPRQPDPPPFDIDERPFIVAATALWVVAFVVLRTVFYDDLRRHHTTWWLWSCLIGIVLGCYGYYFVSRRNSRRD